MACVPMGTVHHVGYTGGLEFRPEAVQFRSPMPTGSMPSKYLSMNHPHVLGIPLHYTRELNYQRQ